MVVPPRPALAASPSMILPRGTVILGWLLALAVGLLAFGALAATALRPRVDAVDRWVTGQVHGYAGPMTDSLMRDITSLGSTVFLVTLVGVIVIALVIRRDRPDALLLVAALVGSAVLNEVLKVVFDRPRPELDWAESIAGPSFPSGHAMNSFVVYVVLGLLVLRWWGPRAGIAALSLSLVVATLVGISRIYLGVHWATDVVAGAIAGALYLLVLVPAWTIGRRVAGPGTTSPHTVPPGDGG